MRGRINLVGAFGYLTDVETNTLLGKFVDESARKNARDGAVVECEIEPERRDVALDRKFMDGVPLHSQDQIKAVPSLRVLYVCEMHPCFAVKACLSLRNFNRTRLCSRDWSAGIDLTAPNNTHLRVAWDDPNTDPALLSKLREVFHSGCEFWQAQLLESQFEVDIPGDQHESLLEGGAHRATRLVKLPPISNKKDLLKRALNKEIMRHPVLFDRPPWKKIACRSDLRQPLTDLCRQRPQASHLPWIAVDASKQSNAEGIFALTDSHLYLAVACPAPLLAGEPEVTREVMRRKLSLYIDVGETCYSEDQQAMMPRTLREKCSLTGGKEDTLALVYPIRRPHGCQRDFEEELPYVAVISKQRVQQLTFSEFEQDGRLPAFVDVANQLAEARLRQSARLGLQHVSTFPSVQLVYNKENEANGLVETQDSKAVAVVEEFSLRVALVTGRLLRKHGMKALVSQQPPLPPTTLENIAARVPGAPATLEGLVQRNRELAAKESLTDEEIILAEWMSHLLSSSSCTVSDPDRVELDIGHFTHGAHCLAPATRPLRNAHHLYNQTQLLRALGFNGPLPDLSPLTTLEGLHNMKEVAGASSLVSKAIQGVQFAIALSKRSFLTKAIVSTVDETGFLLEDFRTHLRCRVNYVSIRHLLERDPEPLERDPEASEPRGKTLSFHHGKLRLEANRTLLPVVIGAIESNGNLSFVVRSVQLEGGDFIPLGHINEYAASLFMERRNLAIPAPNDTFRDTKEWATQFYFHAMTDQLKSSLEQGPVMYTKGRVTEDCITADAPSRDLISSCFAIVWAQRQHQRTEDLPARLGRMKYRFTAVDDAYIFAEVVRASGQIEIRPHPGMSASSTKALEQLKDTQVYILLVPVAQRDADVLRWLQALTTPKETHKGQPPLGEVYAAACKRLLPSLEAAHALFDAHPELLQKARPHVQPPSPPPVRLAERLRKQFGLKDLPPLVTKFVSALLPEAAGEFKLLDVQLRALESMLSEPLTILDGSGGTGKSAVQAIAAALLALCHRAQRTKDALPALVVSEKNASILSFAESLAGLPVRVGWFIAESARSDLRACDFPKNLTLSTDLARLADCDVLLCTNAQARKITRPVSTVFVDEVTTLQEYQLVYTLSVLAAQAQRGSGPLPRLVFSGDLNQSRPYTASTVSTPFSWLERFDSRHRDGAAPPFYFRFVVNFRTDRAPLIRLQKALWCTTVARSDELEGDINAVLPAIYMWNVDGSDGATIDPVDLELIAEQGCPFKWNPTSFLNIEEAWCCLELVKELQREPLNRSDILIVSPYVNQLVLLWHLLHKHGISGCRLRTCTDTSGGQAEIVIVSFVRTTLNAAGEPKGRLDPSHVRTALMRPTSSLFILGSEQWMSRNHRWGTARLLMVIRQEMQLAGEYPTPPQVNRPYCSPLRLFSHKSLPATKSAELGTVTTPREDVTSLTKKLIIGPTSRSASGRASDETLAEPEPVFDLPPPHISCSTSSTQ